MTSAKDQKAYDLEERTAHFGEANYCEADEAGTRKEVKYRISVCCRESRETKYWLRMVVAAVPARKDAGRTIWKEAGELNRIFAAIHRRTDGDNQRGLVIGAWTLVI